MFFVRLTRRPSAAAPRARLKISGTVLVIKQLSAQRVAVGWSDWLDGKPCHLAERPDVAADQNVEVVADWRNAQRSCEIIAEN